jgi:uncharacterized protein
VCNYRCTYCYDLEPDDKLTHLSFDTICEVLREALSLAEQSLCVIFHGGEPTLLPALIKDTVLYGERIARDLGKEISFCGQTNLSRLTEDFVEFSLEHRVRWGVSLDGPEEINDQFRVLRDGSGTYRHFQGALKQFPAFTRKCGVLTVVTSANDRSLLDIARHFRDLGMYGWDWSLFFTTGMGRVNEKELQFRLENVVACWNALFAAVEGGEFDGFAVQPVIDYLQNLILGPGPGMCKRKGCGAARDLLSISSDGSIEACDSIDRKGPLAGLGLVTLDTGDSLSKARDSDVAKRIRSRDVETSGCEECIWLSVCGGTCMAHAPSLHGIGAAECSLTMNAFTKIVHSLASTSALYRYWSSLRRSSTSHAA